MGEHDVQQLRAEVKADFREQMALWREHFDDRLDQDIANRDRMHAENKMTMMRIEDQVRSTNGRVSVLEEAVRTLKLEYEGIRKRWHDFRASIQRVADGLKNGNGNGSKDSDEKPITRKELGILIAIVIGVASMTVTITLWILSHSKTP